MFSRRLLILKLLKRIQSYFTIPILWVENLKFLIDLILVCHQTPFNCLISIVSFIYNCPPQCDCPRSSLNKQARVLLALFGLKPTQWESDKNIGQKYIQPF